MPRRMRWWSPATVTAAAATAGLAAAEGPAGRGGTDGRGGDRAEHHDNDRIDADKATMTADGVSAVVVDELDNVVGVFARHPRPALHDRLVATYGLDAIG
jgi:hypothetical protein